MIPHGQTSTTVTYHCIKRCAVKSIIASISGDPPLDIPFLRDEKDHAAWRDFIRQENLNSEQEEQFKKYFQLLIEWNERMNLTTITHPVDIIAYHFQDSLHIDRFVDFKTISSFVDVGTGAGFPAIPLLIKYPHLTGILIEVNHKKVTFLNTVLEALALPQVILSDVDWRTFLRKTEFDVQLVLSRASLHTDELMRMFKPSSPYKNATLIYWASKEWILSKIEEPFFIKEIFYHIKNKKRRYVFFGIK